MDSAVLHESLECIPCDEVGGPKVALTKCMYVCLICSSSISGLIFIFFYSIGDGLWEHPCES